MNISTVKLMQAIFISLKGETLGSKMFVYSIFNIVY